jgi:uncharacterized damage-inducible protein DinB
VTDPSLFLIGGTPTPNPLIHGLLGMLRYARWTTLRAVENLTVEQLDHRQDSNANSIGVLLLHIAAVEALYQADTFDEREWNAAEKARWQAALDLGPTAHQSIRNHPESYYRDILAEVRARTELELSRRDDAWLSVVGPMLNFKATRYWMWFHVFEDELSHRGQIRWLVKRLPPPP